MMLYRFVDEQKAEGFPIERICEVAGVSTSAYYDWKKHRDGIVTAGELRERLLVNEIRQIHKTSNGTYGSPRVTAELHDRGRVVNHKRVERLMRVYDIVGHTPKKRTVTTIPYAAHRIPDLVKRDFTPDGLDVTWCGDITYIRTWEGFLYLGCRRGSGVSTHPGYVDGQPHARQPRRRRPHRSRRDPRRTRRRCRVPLRQGQPIHVRRIRRPLHRAIGSPSRWAEPGCAGTTHQQNRSSPP